MIIFKEAASLSRHLQAQRKKGVKIGFVPTMGALHEGHLTLIGASEKEAGCTVCSIFINPTQFNNPDDFNHYPVTIEKDIEQLILAGCDVLFLPAVTEIYPAGYRKKEYSLGTIETLWEGAFRPGHFQGVCQVMDRLLDIIQPDQLFMGQKDFQQCMVVRRLLQLTGRECIDFVIVPTVREKDGLAMSSRNLRLNAEERKLATGLYEVLRFIRDHRDEYGTEKLEKLGREQLARKGFQVDYVTIVGTEDLLQSAAGPQVALIAASIGPVRLIDNLPLS